VGVGGGAPKAKRPSCTKGAQKLPKIRSSVHKKVLANPRVAPGSGRSVLFRPRHTVAKCGVNPPTPLVLTSPEPSACKRHAVSPERHHNTECKTLFLSGKRFLFPGASRPVSAGALGGGGPSAPPEGPGAPDSSPGALRGPLQGGPKAPPPGRKAPGNKVRSTLKKCDRNIALPARSGKPMRRLHALGSGEVSTGRVGGFTPPLASVWRARKSALLGTCRALGAPSGRLRGSLGRAYAWTSVHFWWALAPFWRTLVHAWWTSVHVWCAVRR
jgi:hypothetical protein